MKELFKELKETDSFHLDGIELHLHSCKDSPIKFIARYRDCNDIVYFNSHIDKPDVVVLKECVLLSSNHVNYYPYITIPIISLKDILEVSK